MKCALCGFEFEKGVCATRCPGVPGTACAGCTLIRCPHCGYQTPGESKLVDLVRRWLGKSDAGVH